MGVHSGRFAVVNGKSTVRNWSVSETMAPAKGVASNTRNGTLRRRGVRSWSGSYDAYGGRPAAFPGQSFTFQGYTAPDNDTVGGTGQVYSGTAFVSSLALTWNWGSGELISHQVNFAGHMALGQSQAVYSDVTAPNTDEVCGTRVTYQNVVGGGSSSSGLIALDDWDNVVQAVLTVNNALQSYVNSSTLCWTGQKAGPLDWTLAVTEQENKHIASRATGEDLHLRLYIDSTDYWDVMWAKVRDHSGLSANRETGAIIQRTVNLDMNADLNGEIGALTDPDGNVQWPV